MKQLLYYDGVMVMPTILGINALLIAVRLLIHEPRPCISRTGRRERVALALESSRGDRPQRDGAKPEADTE